MNIQDYIRKDKADRQNHINLNSDCQRAIVKRTTQHSEKGELVKSISGMMTRAKFNLLEYLNLEGKLGRKIHTCHLCKNDSSAPNGFVCVNPEHLYFGTISENNLDKPDDVRKDAAVNAAKSVKNRHNPLNDPEVRTRAGLSSFKSEKSNTKKINTCEYCGKQTKGPAHYVHEKYCKLKNDRDDKRENK